MSGTAYKQDLPPPGGYKAIPFMRVPAKTYFSGVQMFLIYNIVTFTSIYGYLWYHKNYIKRNRVEDRGSRMVLQPLMMAEKDRLYLKRCRKLREEEEELMKDVPGWVVGTYWGEPIYHTRPADEWHDITSREFMVHSPHYKYRFMENFFKWIN